MSDRPGSITLGINVRALRGSRGLTQTALAAKAGITKSYVCRIEKGERPVKPELLERLADALGVDAAHLGEATVLQTRTTRWRIEVLTPGGWEAHYEPEDREEAEYALAAFRRRHRDEQWRAVRVETIETVEVW